MRTHDSDLLMGETELSRGILASRAGLRTVAVAQLERAAASLPDDPNVWLWLAWVANSPDNSIRCLERVLELSPGHAAATAGLTWARSLSQDTPIEQDITPLSEAVVEPLIAAAAIVEPELVIEPEPVIDETPAPTIEPISEPVSEGVEVEIQPIVEAAVVSEFFDSPSPETTTEPQWDEPVVAPVAASIELPEEPVAIAPSQPFEESSSEEPRRRWSDLVVQREADASPDAAAWPSLVASSLSSHLPPPLPTVVASSAIAPEPIAASRFSGSFATSSIVPATPANFIGLDQESNADVESLANSFDPPTEDISADGRPLVMVVDDSPTVRKLVSLTLERRGYRVISAFDGVAAIKELGLCRPDLILLDINMPRLDGYRLCKLIKKHEATQSIPVVMLSGKDGMFDKLRGRLVGCSDYITKPFEADALTHKVAKYLTSTSSSL